MVERSWVAVASNDDLTGDASQHLLSTAKGRPVMVWSNLVTLHISRTMTVALVWHESRLL